MQFANATSTGTATGTRTLVTGAYSDKDPSNLNRTTFGATGIEHSEQLNVKLKAAYDFTPTIKGTYTLGVWDFLRVMEAGHGAVKFPQGATLLALTMR